MLIGTPEFSAPEVRAGARNVTTKADVFSIGALVSWFTSITPQQRPTSAAGTYWAELIAGTDLLNPEDRWDLPRVAAHLAPENAPSLPGVDGGRGVAEPALVRAVARDVDECARCGANYGVDGSSRCLACGHLDPY
jgi:serine/threonine protein kinase